MERVKEGKWYWYISINREGVSVNSRIDTYCVLDYKNFESHNYFKTKEEAEAMANKIRAVLKGADVIEMPSEGEIGEYIDNNIKYATMRVGFEKAIEWLKSKIVK